MRSPFASSSRGRTLGGRAGVLLVGSLILSIPGCRRGPPGTALVVLTDEADQDADVYVDGNYVGQVGEIQNATTGSLQLAPGVHRVEIRKPGRFPVQKTVRVDKKPPPQTTVEAQLLEDPQ
jgi:hypothetical protein